MGVGIHSAIVSWPLHQPPRDRGVSLLSHLRLSAVSPICRFTSVRPNFAQHPQILGAPAAPHRPRLLARTHGSGLCAPRRHPGTRLAGCGRSLSFSADLRPDAGVLWHHPGLVIVHRDVFLSLSSLLCHGDWVSPTIADEPAGPRADRGRGAVPDQLLVPVLGAAPSTSDGPKWKVCVTLRSQLFDPSSSSQRDGGLAPGIPRLVRSRDPVGRIECLVC